MTTQIDDVITGVGLLIDGDVVAGGSGTYPVTNPARPAEVVLEAPSTTPAQLDQAVAAARRSQRAWAALAPTTAPPLVVAAAEAGVAAVESRDLARLLTREHGKTHLEAIFDTGHHGRHGGRLRPAGRPRPWPARRQRRVDPDGVGPARRGRPPSCPSTGPSRSWPTRCCPRCWPATPWWSKRRPPARARSCWWRRPWPRCCRPACSTWSTVPTPRSAPPWSATPTSTWSPSPAAWARARPSWPPRPARPGRWSSSSAGTTPPSWPPTWPVDAALADRLVEAAFVTSGQVCMAVKRLYVHRDRFDETVDALAGRLATEVVGDGLAEGVTMGPVHTAGRAGPGGGVHLRGRGGGRRAGAPRPGARRGRGRGRLLRVAGAGGGAAGRRRHRARGAVRPGAAGHPLRRHRPGGRGGQRHRLRVVRLGLEQRRRAGGRRGRRLEAGTVFVNAHGLSAIDMYAPMGGWKQSGFGVELGPEGMQAFARQRVASWCRPGPVGARRHRS